MAINNSVLLQKQIRDNSEDLEREFLDMKQWETQMKRKDEEIQKASVNQVLPPVRRKKVKKVSSKSNETMTKSKRIKGFDYSSWDGFDAEAACKEVEKSDSDSIEEVLSKEELEKNYKLASDYKVKGNKYVSEKKWDKAIACYSQAIKIFPHDAVYYANRALCHIKMDNLYSAESDCTASIQLDDAYIKSYYRRATIRMTLKHYTQAEQDVKKILSLDSSNKDAKLLLDEINKKLSKTKESTHNTSTEGEVKTEEKLKENSCPAKRNVTRIGKKETTKTVKIEEIINTGEIKLNDGVIKRDPRIPSWLPEKDDVSVVEPIQKPPHLRSRQPMKKISIKEADLTKSNNKKIEEIENLDQKDTAQIKEDVPKEKNIEDDIVPSIPKTAVRFLIDWKENKSMEIRYRYLKQLPPNSLSTIFKDSMESDIFSDIIRILKLAFIPKKQPVFQYLYDLSQVKRFRVLVMFLDKADKEGLLTLFEHCKKVEGRSTEEVNKLKTLFEI